MSAPIVHPGLARRRFESAIEPLLAQPEVYRSAGLSPLHYRFPFLDVELDWHRFGSLLRLRVDGTDYNYRPIRGWWIGADGNALMPGSGLVPGNGGAGFHSARQDGTPGCWFCFRGWREYHDHTSHQDVAWAAIRTDPRYSVLALLQQLQAEVNGSGVQRV